MAACCPSLSIDCLPLVVLWDIIFLLQSDRLSLHRFSIASGRVRVLLSQNSSWKRLIHKRFKTLHNIDHINLYLDRLCCLKSLYHRIYDVDQCLDEIHNRIGQNLYRRLGTVLSENKCFSRSLIILIQLKRFFYTLIINTAYSEKRDLHFILQTRESFSSGVGLASTRLSVNSSGELISTYYIFSANTEYFESFSLPVLFNRLKISRDIDIRFKQDFFEIILKQVKNYFGCSIRPHHVFYNSIYCLRRDLFDLVNVTCSIGRLYRTDSVLFSIKSEIRTSCNPGVLSLRDLVLE